MNLRTIKLARKNRLMSRIAAFILTAVIFLSCMIPVSAAEITDEPVGERYNSWCLCTSQVDTSYFYSGGTSLSSSWDVSTQNAWILCKNLASDFNFAVVETSLEKNAIKMMEKLYDAGFSSQAISMGTLWNRMRNQITNLITDCSATCNSSTDKAEAQALYSQIQASYDTFNKLMSTISETYSNFRASTGAVADPMGDGAVTIFNFLWNQLGVMLKTVGTGSGSASNFFGLSISNDGILSIVNMILPIIKTFAYAIAVVLFGINITQTAFQYEILTLRGGVKVFARVILVKVWIDLAVPICMYALTIINSLARQLLNAFVSSNNYLPDYQSVTYASNSGWLSAINGILGWLTGFITSLPTIAILVAVIISVISVFIKLISRAFELTALTALSPLFFATLVGDETRRYFRRFMSGFLSTAGYILFMSISFVVATKWIQQCTSTVVGSWNAYLKYMMNLLPQAIIIIACCRIMRKPPKVLTGLLDGG